MAVSTANAIVRAGSSHDTSVPLESLTSGEELAKCKALREEVPGARPDQVVRFLRARDGDIGKAAEMLENHLAWRKVNLPLRLTEQVRSELEKRKFCFFGEDFNGSRVVIARLKLMGKHTYDSLQIAEQALMYLAEFMESHLKPLEKITVVFSRLDAERSNSDLDWVKMAGGLFQNNYPERLNRAVVAPINMIFRGLWAVVQYFFDPNTREKIVLAKDASVFLTHVPAEHLPTELGGANPAQLTADEIIAYADEENERQAAAAEGSEEAVASVGS